MSIKPALCLVCCVLLVATSGDFAWRHVSRAAAPRIRPNIVVIVLDDADINMFSQASLQFHFPNIGRIAREGIQFTNCHVTTPICAPSRACFLRGQYAHNTGVRVNDATIPFANGFGGGYPNYKLLEHDDLPVWLNRVGYHTMLVGKYLHNNYDFTIPPGWDDFYVSLGSTYFGTHRFTTRDLPTGQNSQIAPNQYRTTVEADDANRLIKRHLTSPNAGSPFFMYVTPLAPHDGIPRDERVDPAINHWWSDMRMPLGPNFNEHDMSDKPEVLQKLPTLDGDQVTYLNSTFRERMLSVKSVDDMVGSLYATLAAYGQLENTFIIFTSDHGYLLGQHRVYGKSLPFDSCTQVPLFIRGPNVAANVSANHLLAQIDLAPTIVDLARGQIPAFVDGQSFVPLLYGPEFHPEESWREPILIEHWESTLTLGTQVLTTFSALRMYDEIFVHWASGEDEYYDLSQDPWQLDNAIHQLDPAIQEMFAAEMRRIRTNGTPPIGAVTRPPFVATPLVGIRSTLHGYAEDDEGVERVRLIIRNLDHQTFWNGNRWQSGYAQITPNLKRVSGFISQWQYTLNLAGDTSMSASQISVSARAVDRQGNVSTADPLVMAVDVEPPDTGYTIPVVVTNTRQVRINGTASDNHQVAHVLLILRDISTGRYWDGSQWVNERTTMTFKVSKENRWHYIVPMPPGRYGIWSRAVDSAGNFDPTPASEIFRVK